MKTYVQADNEFYTVNEDSDVICLLCHHKCRIGSDKFGNCSVRLNQSGVLVLPFYGHITATAIDPVEKKPLYHFYPGKKVFSVGLVSCNLHCPFCQNYHISQSIPDSFNFTSPEELVRQCIFSGTDILAFTYSEPLIHFEYILSVFTHAKENGLKTVLVTNGLISSRAFTRLLKLTDAVNIDLKTFSAITYKNVLGGDLGLVCLNIELAAAMTFTEVTTLVVPGISDSELEFKKMINFLSGISSKIPWHLSAYYPQYKYNEAPTDHNLVLHFKTLAEKKMEYVYCGNFATDNNTYCPGCGKMLIERNVGKSEIKNMKKNQCSSCGYYINIFPDIR